MATNIPAAAFAAELSDVYPHDLQEGVLVLFVRSSRGRTNLVFGRFKDIGTQLSLSDWVRVYIFADSERQGPGL